MFVLLIGQILINGSDGGELELECGCCCGEERGERREELVGRQREVRKVKWMQVVDG